MAIPPRGPGEPPRGAGVGGPPPPPGTTFAAPDAVAVSDVEGGKMPTRKSISAVVAAVLIALARILLEALDVELDDDIEQLINGIVPLVVAYLVPNSPTPGGVPDAKPKILDLTPDEPKRGAKL